MKPQIISAINEVAVIVNANAEAKGFHSDPFHEFVPKTCANMHGEVSELWEAYRNGILDKPCDKDCGLTNAEEELADIIIRALDTSKRLGLDIGNAIAKKHAYNTTRPFKHGKIA